MRPALLSVFAPAILTIACGDVARTEIDLRFPDDDTLTSTRQLLIVIREPAPNTECSSVLWGTPPSGFREGAWFVDYPNAIDISVARLPVGPYTMFVYALPSRLDRLCDGDDKCAGSLGGPSCKPLSGGQRACVPASSTVPPIAGGCGSIVIEEQEVGSVVLRLDPAP